MLTFYSSDLEDWQKPVELVLEWPGGHIFWSDLLCVRPSVIVP